MQLYPECTSGNSATLIRYKGIFCAQIDPRIWTDNSTCIDYLPFQSVPAVMFACDVHVRDQSQAKTTTTVSASYTTASASTATAPSSFQDPTKSPTGSTSTRLIKSATSGPSTPPASSQASPSGVSGNNDPNLSQAGQIALGVVLPLGAIGVAVLAWIFPKPWKKTNKEGMSGG